VFAAAFALLLYGEIYTADEPITAHDLFFDIAHLVLLVGCTVASTLLALRVQAQEEETRLLQEDLQAVRAERQRWREELAHHLRAVGEGIRRQFAAWQLTAAEQDVAMLLLKGFSHKEIARLRRTSEATVRQQAAAIYQKAGLGGRAALSAFFLDDLLAQPPADQAALPPW
jgi:DNA-binding NarL/FixJ family response regulator